MLAKEMTAAWRPGEGEIKFVIGDMVRIGNKRLVWQIQMVGVNYSVYDENKVYSGSYNHYQVGRDCEPIGWHPTPNLGKDKSGYGKIGDVIRVTKPSGGNYRAEVGKEYTIGLVREQYFGKGINTSRELPTHLDPGVLELADVEPRDREGRTPVEAFEAVFGGKGSYVVDSPYWTDSETLGVVQAITPNGAVRVGLFSMQSVKWEGQESFEPDKGTIDEVKVYRPKLFSGEWGWWTERRSIHPYKGGKLTRLLD
jgi:hypothetical protein